MSQPFQRLMPAAILLILLTVVGPSSAKLTDELAGKLISRERSAWPIHCAGLENSLLAKAIHTHKAGGCLGHQPAGVRSTPLTARWQPPGKHTAQLTVRQRTPLRRVAPAADGGKFDARAAESTIAAIDSLLNVTAMEEEVPEPANVDDDKKWGDQRLTFRSLATQSKRQQYISKLVSMVFQRTPTPPDVMLPNVEWLTSSAWDEMRAEDPAGAQMRLPVIAMPYNLAPGELITLNLFEPTLITLFAKLIADKSSSRMMRSRSGLEDIDLDADGVILRENPIYTRLIPGYGRVNESSFVGTRRFAVCLKSSGFGTNEIATVGTVAEIVGTDVEGEFDEVPSLIIIARGVQRFRATQLQQRDPYFVVDAEPLVDDAENGGEEVDRALRKKIMEALCNMTESFTPEVIVDRLRSEKVELTGQREDVVAEVKAQANKLTVLALSVMLLRSLPNAAQAVLASTSASQRRQLVDQLLDYREQEAGKFNFVNFFKR
eukprot:gnl/TRDRNA2_/TRDRNA2_125910_c0_seq1.p1 gnl/TRDRNA2_/TRDRNA2_125910_c0~~gnl/TRDRNA2_/TRDRNA2_125910_c0_seq1.p1  ORF type:complete len:490 (-),score=86.84 gnl/TRDRNA2_/TRDRNA2_125910_c0_seq1:30-1499(-)